MQTRFSPAQLADPDMASSEAVIRKCVHCGFCTATCPTYVVLGDELDSPRGRIYLMKEMLEHEAQPTAEVVKHIDRCLSCLSCMTTCPSGVNYAHLVDHARAYIEDRYRRPLRERLLRGLLAWVLPHPKRFRAALALARIAKPAEPMLRRFESLKPVAAMLALAPARLPKVDGAPPEPSAAPKGRVVLLVGCAEPVLRPEFRAAAQRLLARAGYEVVTAAGEGCCGALVHHMGRKAEALDDARRNVDAWTAEIEGEGIEAILVTASGCGTTLKDYGFMLREDPAYAGKAAKVSALAKDVTEFLLQIELPPPASPVGLRVAYHAACSLQHGQKITEAPKQLLKRAGFDVRTPADAHLCCGSAGVYNILQPELADAIGRRKAETLDRLEPDVIAHGNIGCATQIALRTKVPVAHTVELLDWAHGGPRPSSLPIRPDR
jgi:glycolate oxidase iron-sulfur subunit